MLEIIESAAGLHHLAIELRLEGKNKHSQMLLKTIELELSQIFEDSSNAKIQERDRPVALQAHE